MRATLDLTRCADWVEVHMVTRSPSTRAATARASIALGMSRWIRKSSESSTSPEAASGAPSGWSSQTKARFPSASS